MVICRLAKATLVSTGRTFMDYAVALSESSIDERRSWANGRETKREETR